MKPIRSGLCADLVALGLVGTAVLAQTASGLPPALEATLRKTLGDRLPQLGKIDEISKTPMPGLYEVRVGMDILYTDTEGNFVFQGQLIDTKQQRNLTED